MTPTYCRGCVFDYYEYDTNWGCCKHPDFDEEQPDHCPGYCSEEDAKAEARDREGRI